MTFHCLSNLLSYTDHPNNILLFIVGLHFSKCIQAYGVGSSTLSFSGDITIESLLFFLHRPKHITIFTLCSALCETCV